MLGSLEVQNLKIEAVCDALRRGVPDQIKDSLIFNVD